jgi:sulfatase maturation enzyme AslB (radical SAM superfamily)
LDEDHKRFVISFEEIDQKIKFIIKQGNCHEIELLGGEIFLYLEKVLYIFDKYSKEFSFIVTTNGTIRNNDIDKMIDKYKPRMGVSLDDPLTVSQERIGLNFETVLKNAKYWNNITEVIITAVITPRNIRRIKETFDFYILEHGFKRIHFGVVVEWMNAYYWGVYKKEVFRLIQSEEIGVLKQVVLSPWQHHVTTKKSFIYEDGIEKLEIYNPNQIELNTYTNIEYNCYVAYCKRVGITPDPLVPAGVQVVAAYN